MSSTDSRHPSYISAPGLLWWPKFLAALFYPRISFSYFGSKVLFSLHNRKILTPFFFNRDIYLENIGSIFSASPDINNFSVQVIEQVLRVSYKEIHSFLICFIIGWFITQNMNFGGFFSLKVEVGKNIWSNDVDFLLKMFFNLWNFNCIFQSCGIFCVILTVNKNQGAVLMILDDFKQHFQSTRTRKRRWIIHWNLLTLSSTSRILPLFQVSQSYYSQLTFYPKKTKLTKATTFEAQTPGQSI